jgi:GT2 family glycosyltransferase
MQHSLDTARGFSVSVVIPTVDRGALLLRSLNSALVQTRPPAEVLLVDNGREPVCSARLDSRVRVIRTAPRIGISRARNTGARAATGEFVAFLDDDDFWQEDYLEQVAKRFIESDADAVLGQLMRLNDDGTPRPYKLWPQDAEDQRRVFYSNPGIGGNLTIRRDLFLAFGGFDEAMPASVDRDLAARLLLAEQRLVPAAQAIAVRCEHEGARVRDNRLRGNWMFILKHWRRMRTDELYRACKVLLSRSVGTGRLRVLAKAGRTMLTAGRRCRSLA